MFYIGIDLGGTNITAAAISDEGRILGRVSLPTLRGGAETPVLVADTIKNAAEQAAAKAELSLAGAASIGIGAAGTVDPVNGVIRHWSNLNFENVPLLALLRERFPSDIPLHMDNDANAAALGEYTSGAGKGSHSLVAVTLGTGVGGGAVLDGKLYTGYNHTALEVGHFVIREGGRPCTCGRRGCFEAYCSATGLLRGSREAMKANPNSALWAMTGNDSEALSAKLVFDAADSGDETAQDLVEEYILMLASGITSLVNIFQPEVLCLGGGISKQWPRLSAPLHTIFDREDYSRGNSRRTRLVRAELGNDAGLIGAAFLGKYR